MSPALEQSAIVEQLYAAAGLPWPPSIDRVLAPVPLGRLLAAHSLTCEEVPGLTRAAAAEFLDRRGVPRPDMVQDATPLAGLLLAGAGGGCILVRREDSLARRRFTAAHALGHYLLHLRPQLPEGPAACLVQEDTDETVREGEEKTPLAPRDRQANAFALELLVPEVVVRGLHAHYRERFVPTARFLEHQLESGLLVSREAARWRLRELGLKGMSSVV
jgi:hypothetical protein